MKRADFFGADVHDDAEVRRQYNLLIEQMDFSTRYLKLNYGIRDQDLCLARRHGTMNALTLAHLCVAVGECSPTPEHAAEAVTPLVQAFAAALTAHLIHSATQAAEL